MKTPEELAEEVWDGDAFWDFDPRGKTEAVKAIAAGIRRAMEECAAVADAVTGEIREISRRPPLLDYYPVLISKRIRALAKNSKDMRA